jgi:hypothetical protein
MFGRKKKNKFTPWQKLTQATQMGRVMVSNDPEMLQEARRWLVTRKTFAGLIYFPPDMPDNDVIEGIAQINEKMTGEEMMNRIVILGEETQT